ncbi:alpha-galactosidase [Sphingorhabdus sp. Alg239-R122]|uniref:alpha-galactosidase n=1 Tax=Sphingorhabdus sp. Alg239-R122 TaxID=2305989 RepID=UPI0013D8FAA5|nr:alpha-galactosidase [Sphingorhabdus sp. Alg239-R122]
MTATPIDPKDVFLLTGGDSSLAVHAPVGGMPQIVYWGARLEPDADMSALVSLTTRQNAQGGADTVVPLSLSCESGTGFAGPTGFDGHRDGHDWAPVFRIMDVQSDGQRLDIHCADDLCGIGVLYVVAVDAHSGVLTAWTRFTNTGDMLLTIDRAAALCLPLLHGMDDIIHFSGRWAHEFQSERQRLGQGGFVIENRRGRTSHDRFPGAIFCAPQTHEQAGPCIAVHLGWSGNHMLRADRQMDGQVVIQAGEKLFPGEVQLSAGEAYETPPVYACYVASGLSDISGRLHEFYRTRLADKRVLGKSRPVHYNTWEAIYFAHEPGKVMALAGAAAEMGAERFVLDDGWFLGRRGDAAGLGDWQVDRSVYPGGLKPVIDHVHGLGMEFGLWVEPEMVNADSDLYRAHPDWILCIPDVEQVPFRNQYVLDLTRREVSDNLFGQIDALLRDNAIDYLKWDMNRDISHPGGDGRVVAGEQVRAVYALIERLRTAHPEVEIESCASGGGRADYGILAHTDRIWTSDSNDALDRQAIQRGASHFFPLEVMGAHVGPEVCHITRRTLSIELRAATALFGHMGVEADITRMSEREKVVLADAIGLYKAKRDLLHSGQFVRINAADWQNIIGVVAKDKASALFSYAQIGSMPETLPGMLRFPGLGAARHYRLKCVWPIQPHTPTPHRLENSALMGEGIVASGDILMKVGLQLPVLFPESCIVLEIEAV